MRRTHSECLHADKGCTSRLRTMAVTVAERRGGKNGWRRKCEPRHRKERRDTNGCRRGSNGRSECDRQRRARGACTNAHVLHECKRSKPSHSIECSDADAAEAERRLQARLVPRNVDGRATCPQRWMTLVPASQEASPSMGVMFKWVVGNRDAVDACRIERSAGRPAGGGRTQAPLRRRSSVTPQSRETKTAVRGTALRRGCDAMRRHHYLQVCA